MKQQLKIFAVCFVSFLLKIECNGCDMQIQNAEKEALHMVEKVNENQIKEYNLLATANWNYATNINAETAKKKTEAQEVYATFIKENALKLLKFDTKNFKNETLKRLIKKMTNIGDAILETKDFLDLKEATMQMESRYSSAKVPSYKDPNKLFNLEPEITNALISSRDPEELKYYWTKWHETTGTPSKDNFFEYVRLRNKASKINNYTSGAEAWLDSYEDPEFEKKIEELLSQLSPLYKQLHGYVRHKLSEFYGPEHVDVTKPIPLHFLGNMWGQQWIVSDIVSPYNNIQKVDVTDEMLKQNYTPKKMFEMAENFFVSLNMSKMPEAFWSKSVIEKPNDNRDMVCHASAWDFAVDGDVRIKQCTRVTMESLITVHHEMGHVEYYLHYHKQPFEFRTSANPGFHEAVGDVLALSVSTNRHLQRVGLLKDFVPSDESEINHLMRLGLEKLVFLPFAFVMDKFRYEVFRGNVKPEEANCYFWKLREKYSGVEPSIVRTNRDFDITAKFHASADVEYLRYFVSFIVQFQFHKAACTKAGEFEANNPKKTLNNCDIYTSAEAGNALKSMLEMGSSKPWPEAMEKMTGQRDIDASAILEYFKPLHNWLLKTNKELGVHLGWDESDKIDCSI